MQNKIHYAITGHTVAELIYAIVDSDKEHMGLTNWRNSPDGLIYKYDVGVPKNYLNDSGKISHRQAVEKAEGEYEKI